MSGEPRGVATLVRQGHAVGADRVFAVARGEVLVLAVADGASGMPGAAEAAEQVVGEIRRGVEALEARSSPGTLVRFLEDIDAALVANPEAGESTAVLAVLCEGRVTGASVGDSGAWVIAGDGHRELTRGQHRTPRLGAGGARPVGFEAPLGEDLLLMGSDGLFGVLPGPEIAAGLHDLEPGRALARLERKILARFGAFPDDLGMVAFRSPSTA